MKMKVFNLKAELKGSEEQRGIIKDIAKHKEELLAVAITKRDKLQKHVDKSNKEVRRGREDLGDVRHMNWDSITEAILTYSFILKNDEFELITIGGKDVVVVNKELENKYDIAKLVVIKFLNSKTKLELRQLGVKDRTRLVMDENKVHQTMPHGEIKETAKESEEGSGPI